jgi:hypothetical protein
MRRSIESSSAVVRVQFFFSRTVSSSATKMTSGNCQLQSWKSATALGLVASFLIQSNSTTEDPPSLPLFLYGRGCRERCCR